MSSVPLNDLNISSYLWYMQQTLSLFSNILIVCDYDEVYGLLKMQIMGMFFS